MNKTAGQHGLQRFWGAHKNFHFPPWQSIEMRQNQFISAAYRGSSFPLSGNSSRIGCWSEWKLHQQFVYPLFTGKETTAYCTVCGGMSDLYGDKPPVTICDSMPQSKQKMNCTFGLMCVIFLYNSQGGPHAYNEFAKSRRISHVGSSSSDP